MKAIQIAILQQYSDTVQRLDPLVLEVSAFEDLLVDNVRYLFNLALEHRFSNVFVHSGLAQPIRSKDFSGILVVDDNQFSPIVRYTDQGVWEVAVNWRLHEGTNIHSYALT